MTEPKSPLAPEIWAEYERAKQASEARERLEAEALAETDRLWECSLECGEAETLVRHKLVERLSPRLPPEARQILGAGHRSRVLESTPALRMVRKWWESYPRRPVLILCGPPGVGKSFAAASGLLDITMRHFPESFERMRRRVRNYVHATARDFSDSEADELARGLALGRIVRAPHLPRIFDPWADDPEDVHLSWTHWALVIDDLGTESPNSRWLGCLEELVDARHAADRIATIVTTNLRKHEIRSRYGDRIADRWNEGAMVVELAGPSLRGRDGGAGL